MGVPFIGIWDFEVHTYLVDVQSLRTSTLGILVLDADKYNMRLASSLFFLIGAL